MTKSKLYSNFAIPDSLNTSKKNFDSRFAGGWRANKKEFRSFKSKFPKVQIQRNPSPRFPSHQCIICSHSSPSKASTTFDSMLSSSFNPTNTKASDDSNNNTSSDDSSGDEDDDEVLVEQDQQESSTTKLSPYHAKNYFNSTMGGKDLQVLFAMAIRCTTHDLPNHKDAPFSKAKVYHSEVKPDAATLKLEVTRRWKAYFFTCCQPHPSNWKIDKCTDYLMSHPNPTSEAADLDFFESELKEWTGIQEMINESHENEED